MNNEIILVVDDDEDILNFHVQVFSRAGYTVKAAKSAEEALKILKENNIHVMFLDLNMPEMNGLELCVQLRKNRPMDIIYAVTGYTSLFELTDCRDAGFDDYFTKPVGLKTLTKAAQDAFEKINRWKKR